MSSGCDSRWSLCPAGVVIEKTGFLRVSTGPSRLHLAWDIRVECFHTLLSHPQGNCNTDTFGYLTSCCYHSLLEQVDCKMNSSVFKTIKWHKENKWRVFSAKSKPCYFALCVVWGWKKPSKDSISLSVRLGCLVSQPSYDLCLCLAMLSPARDLFPWNTLLWPLFTNSGIK